MEKKSRPLPVKFLLLGTQPEVFAYLKNHPELNEKLKYDVVLDTAQAMELKTNDYEAFFVIKGQKAFSRKLEMHLLFLLKLSSGKMANKESL